MEKALLSDMYNDTTVSWITLSLSSLPGKLAALNPFDRQSLVVVHSGFISRLPDLFQYTKDKRGSLVCKITQVTSKAEWLNSSNG